MKQTTPTKPGAEEDVSSEEMPHGYYGTGSRVHGFVKGRTGWIPVCKAGDDWAQNFGYRDDELPRTTRPIDCLRCLKKLGKIDRYPGPYARRDRAEAEHLIKSVGEEEP